MTDWMQDVAGASRGDAPAIEALLQRHLPKLRAFVRLRMGRDLRAKESASDLVQSTCREVLEHAGRFRHGDEAGFRHWLFTEALRKIHNRVAFYRAAKRDVGREVAADLDAGELAATYADLDTPSAALSLKERVAQFEAAFDRLTDEHREVITLARIVGLSHRQIGEVMGRSETASRMLLYRALADLAAEIERADTR